MRRARSQSARTFLICEGLKFHNLSISSGTQRLIDRNNVMIRYLSFLLPILLSGLLSVQLHAQSAPVPDNIEWTGVDQALKRAADEEKLVLINVYADWCPYCRRMHREVYPDERVEKPVSDYFIPVVINTESEDPVTYLGNKFTESEFAVALQYSSVPTTFFMNSNGEVIGQQPGYLPAELFSKLLEYVGSGAYESISFEEFDNQ